MTDVVIPSRDRTVNANAESAVNFDAVTERIIPPDERALELPEEGLDSGAFGAFEEDGVNDASGHDWELTIKSGEAFIGGSYCARDTKTTIAGDFTDGDRVVALGWEYDSADGLVIQPASDFDDRDRSIDLYRVVDNGGTPKIDEDFRVTHDSLQRDVAAPDRVEAPIVEGTTEVKSPTIQSSDSLSTARKLTVGPSENDETPELEFAGVSNALLGVSGIISADGINGGDERIRFFLSETTRQDPDNNVIEIVPVNSVHVETPLAVIDTAQLFDDVEIYGDLQVGNSSDGSMLKLVGRDSDPSDPPDGSLWYRSDLDEYRGVENGNKVTFDTTTV